MLIKRKHVQWVSLVLAALFLSSCGSSDSRSTTATTSAHPTSAKPPAIRVPSGPPPKKVVIKDLVQGKGVAIPPISGKHMVEISTLYKAVSYKTGKPFEERWDPRNPFEIEFGPGLENEGWEKGMIGMRVGGRRELIVPSRMAYNQGSVVYVIDLLGVKKSARE
jgi:FKBP-type peptidyl-prolyl cis-trans isomerase